MLTEVLMFSFFWRMIKAKNEGDIMGRKPRVYPHTPEGLAQKERDMTKNCHPVGLGNYPHRKLLTKEKFLEDMKEQIIKNTKKPEKSNKKVRGEGLRTQNNMTNMAQSLLNYSMDIESLDVHGFLRNIGLSPNKFYQMMDADPILADAYEQAKSNFSYNNLKILRRKLNTVALSKYASLHSAYSDPLRAERKKDKEFDQRLGIQVHQQLQEERKNNAAAAPEVKVVVMYE